MTTQVQDLAELDATAVQQSLDLITQLTQEEHPTVDVRFGAVHNLLLLPSAEHAAANQENIRRYEQSSSLKTITEDPSLADNDQVDLVLSNKGLTRQEGTVAVGDVTIVVSALAPVTIASGTQFTGGGQAFVTTATFAARTSAANVEAASDRVLTALGDGNYSFTIPIEAAEVGSASLLKKGTLVETETVITNLVKIYATSDFTGGINTETNAQLLVREQEGLAAQCLSNRINAAALLRAQADFASLVSLSIIGLGDAEMLRDQHSIFPGSFGGRTDFYVRTAELPPATLLVLEATLIQKTSDGKGTWQLTIDRDAAPGYYDLVSITPDESAEFAGTFPIVAERRSTNLTALMGELLPDIVNTLESVYSRFQSVVVQFSDTETDTAALTVNTSTQDYQVTVRVMPQIAELQTFLGSRSHRNLFGDVLVKAPIPCFVSLSFTLQGRPQAPLPDVAAIKTALTTYVNRLPFTGRLYATALADIIYNYLADGITVDSVDMLGRILRPDGSVRSLHSDEILVVPDEPDNMVTARTVGFILTADDIHISAATLNTPEIL